MTLLEIVIIVCTLAVCLSIIVAGGVIRREIEDGIRLIATVIANEMKASREHSEMRDTGLLDNPRSKS
jgi:hypothetical protein